jgi:hypothetical protein
VAVLGVLVNGEGLFGAAGAEAEVDQRGGDDVEGGGTRVAGDEQREDFADFNEGAGPVEGEFERGGGELGRTLRSKKKTKVEVHCCETTWNGWS